GDIEYIKANIEELMKDYRGFISKLEKLKESGNAADDKDKPDIDPDELADAYEALKELVSMMDYDGVQMVLDQLGENKLPKEDEDRIKELTKNLKLFDWDAMEKLLEF
ncbi:MAG: hypothetical protein IKZ97_05470, partial [Butyrivibrio sp.]|nr:hypothetical protein [Butyrivibrio sp.]